MGEGAKINHSYMLINHVTKSTPKFDPFEFDPDPFDVDKHRNVSYSDVSIILRSLTAIIYFIHVLYYLKIILVQFIYFIHA